MDLSRRMKNRMKKYRPKGGLDKTLAVIMALLGMSEPLVSQHASRVALTAEDVGKKMMKDTKALFFAAALHDIGKLILPPKLFDGRNISAKEYRKVKRHAIASFLVLKDAYLFIALCAGLHHAMYEWGYGLTIDDFPKFLSLRTIKKILEIATIIAICDDIDSALHRKTKLRHGAVKGMTLQKRLEKKFPDDIFIVRLALKEAKKFA